MIEVPIALGPLPTRELLAAAIADLLSRAPSHLALQEPEETADGWTATGTFYAREAGERARDELVLIDDVGRLLRKYHGLHRQRRGPIEGEWHAEY
jgi:hypothetical protein